MIRFLLFILLVGGVVLLGNTVLSNIFDQLYQRMRTGQTGGEINKYLALPTTPQLLIMGNSRARYQVDPDSFAVPTYSLCHAGMGQVFQTDLLDILIKENKLPKAILLHVDLAEYVDDDNLEDAGNLRYYYNKVPAVTRDINDIRRFEYVKYLFSFYRYNGRIISTIKNYFQSRHTQIGGNGYQQIQPIAVDSMAMNEVPVMLTPPRFHYQNLRHLERFLTICRQRHIQLLCFTSPYYVTRPFTQVAAPPLDSLLRRQRIPYLNASANPLPRLLHHATFWQDVDHLNILGASYFSQQIAHWADPYLVSAADSSRLR